MEHARSEASESDLCTKQTHRILQTVLRQYAAGAPLQASVVRGCDKIARVMTLSYDFLHEHAIGGTSNESARTTYCNPRCTNQSVQHAYNLV